MSVHSCNSLNNGHNNNRYSMYCVRSMIHKYEISRYFAMHLTVQLMAKSEKSVYAFKQLCATFFIEQQIDF